MWRRILKFSLFLLCLLSNINRQCSGAKKKENENSNKVNPPTPKRESPPPSPVTTNEKRENFFEAAELSYDVISDNYVLRSSPVSTLLSCALECIRDSECKSILVKRYHQNEVRSEPYECQLISGRRFLRLPVMSTASEILYFVRKDANNFYTNS